MKSKGFTLVELLASIVLLGVIVGITIVGYDKYVEKSELDTFKASLSGIIRTLEIYITENPNENFSIDTTIDKDVIDGEFLNNIKSGTFKVEENKIILTNVSDGNFCGNGSKNNFTVKTGEC